MLSALDHHFAYRDYQIKSAQEAFELLFRKNNVEIDLPTGTGKTLIANQVSWLWLSQFEHANVLYLVPRRILVPQHRFQAGWMAPSFYMLDITETRLDNIFKFRPLLVSHRMIVSTPRILTSAIRNDLIPRNYLSEISLVIVDEYDTFLVLDYDEKSIFVRWHKDFENLIPLLLRKPNFLLLSATSPLSSLKAGSSDPLVRKYSGFVKKRLNPICLNIDSSSYYSFLPTASITFLMVYDDWVHIANDALKIEFESTIQIFEEKNEIKIDREYLFSRINGIIGHKTKVILAFENKRRKFIPVFDEIITLCFQLKAITNKYQFLYEDMFEGFQIQMRQQVVFLDGEFKTINQPYLVDQRSIHSFSVRLRGKGKALMRLVDDHPDQKGVIFTRYVHLSEKIIRNLANLPIPIFHIDGNQRDAERNIALAGFKNSESCILVITRDTGKRGLDLPQADYAIFYSPKNDERSVWQEVSRIRSCIDSTKETYFLCYQSTSEDDRKTELINQMSLSKHAYKIRQKVFEDAI